MAAAAILPSLSRAWCMISKRQLAEFCRRGATSFHAGLDIRQIFRREATIGSRRQRRHMEDIARRIDAGETVGDAMAAQGYFPPLTVELVHVGELTGKLERVWRQLAEHYENLISLRRVFLMGLIWPAIQLTITLLVIGLMIYVQGLIADTWGGDGFDMLGIGIGRRGLRNYFLLLGLLALLAAIPVVVVRQGWLLAAPIMRFLLRIPMLGPCLRYLALSRVAWSLAMAIDAGMSATDSLRLALRASQNAYYTSAWPAVARALERRCTMVEALRASGRFPEEFLMILETGELTGMISESLHHHADDLRDRAQALLRTLTVLAGTACSLVVMLLIGMVVLRMGMAYVDMLNNAGNF
jgi:type II secretory pathway component PulF